jgi:hypothetical protein
MKGTITYTNGGFSSGDIGYPDDYIKHYDNYYDFYYYYYPICYPTVEYVKEKSKVEQAFKILGKLMENKLIKDTISVKKFVKLVNEIANVI